MRPIPALASSLLAILAAPALAQQPVEQGPPNAPGFEPAFPEQTRAPASDSGMSFAVEELATGLVHPWGIAVLPDGDMLVTERPGRMRVVTRAGETSDPIKGIPEVHDVDQGGLLDVALGPNFDRTRTICWTYAKPMGEGMSATAAACGALSDDRSELTQVEDVFVQDPPSPVAKHYGSRILFDGEGRMFITTGEHFAPSERVHAQDLGKTYGKVIRLTPSGEVPEGNPFAGREGAVASIWTYGHRNIQGADIRPSTGELWIVEHGPKGGDELNLIEAGANYGWPEIAYGVNYSGTPVGTGEARGEGFTQPRYYWDPVIAPGGMLFYEGGMYPDRQGDVFIASLRPGGIVRLELDGDVVVGEERLLTEAGRVRDVAVAQDGALLAVTDKPNGALLRLTPAD